MFAARRSTVEDSEVLFFEVGSTLDGAVSEDMVIGLFDIGWGESQMSQSVEEGVFVLLIGHAEGGGAEILAED